MGRVAHYLPRWLELSAGFVAAQVGHSRHYGLVISRDAFTCLEAFPYQPRRSLHMQHVPYRSPQRVKDLVRTTQLSALLAAYRVDLLHVHFGHSANDVLGAVGRRPYVLSLHGHDITGLLHTSPNHYTRVFGEVDAVTVPSRFLAAKTIAAGFDETLIRVLPSGVDTSFFTPAALPDGPPIVAFVGRLVPKKGLDVLLEAWPRIHAELPDARLHVLGEGRLAPLLEQTDDSVTWFQPDPTRRHEQVRDLLRSATVVVTPSRTAPDGDSESLLLVNLEASACGRPVVSTRHGGIPEYVEDGNSGLLVEEGNADELGAAIVRVLGDRALADRLAKGGVDNAAKWDVKRCAAAVDDLYDELMARPRK
ncbi:MAG TPA: glycosyltransferase [Mycobacteriales bacterium]|nr:glycosyltransferase [Mycobacteriales bacterium]HWC34248.1 glycosyltransferase [Mycobacteriales bacterium]